MKNLNGTCPLFPLTSSIGRTTRPDLVTVLIGIEISFVEDLKYAHLSTLVYSSLL